MITVGTSITQYRFDNFSDAVKRMNQWVIDGLVTEKELCGFIMQLFHQIPENIYNDITDNS